MEIKCLQIEDVLSRYADYLAENADRLPMFRSVEEAESELERAKKRLYGSISDIDEKMRRIELKHAELREEEMRVTQVKKVAQSSKNREKAELIKALKRLEAIDDQWKLRKAQSAMVAAAQKQCEELSDSLNRKKAILQRLKRDDTVLKQQEKKLLYEIDSIGRAKKEMEMKEMEMSKIEKKTNEGNNELLALSNKINEKLKIIDEKKKSLSFLLSKSEKVVDFVSSIVDDSEQIELKEINELIQNANKAIKFRVVDPLKTMEKIESIIGNG